uniref:3-deoxy-manno-octulosonate cytidylyltransferase, mitochondrial-like n=1 Tax=Nicotiana tabacum TaxID=4097 RepID=A0A1S4DR16_TOBAC|nr:PREDICTED: 3-deoxy-manno-octulosonate cytidylyltransferase, mitochondrial-like [Nicotiana tabacum]
MSHPEKNQWMKAMQEDMESLQKNGTFKLVELPKGGAISWQSRLQNCVALSTTEAEFVQAAPDAVFSTAVTSLKPEDAYDPNRVKCVVDNLGYAIYFSRGLIPYNKSGKVNPQFPYLLHLGIQSYDTKFLKIYPELTPTPLQLEEDLEQLKVLENGYKMKVIKVDHETHGVDTPEDVEKIERFMRERNLA